MTLREVPDDRELFELAVATRGGCRRFSGERAEDTISLLAVASFQLQAAHVGARMAAMASDSHYTAILRAVSTDYGGAFSAALNLSVRCSVTVIDLCAASLGRLSGRSTSHEREMDAAEIRKAFEKTPPSPEFDPLAAPFRRRLDSSEWTSTEHLRHQLTHRRYKRGVYGTTLRPPDPAPLAFPRQIEVEWRDAMVPLDEATGAIVDFADATFREFCTNLASLASP